MAIDPMMYPGGMMGGLGPAVLGTIIVIGLAVYVYAALALMAIAKKTKTPNAWLAWIPIANIYLVTQIGKQSGWWTLGILVAIIPILGTLAVIALMIFLYWKLAEAIKKPGWWGVLMVIPVVNLVMLGIMAWGE